MPDLTELIEQAPWREAVTYRDTWPHEYVMSTSHHQRELLAAICERFHDGEGVSGRFLTMQSTYLFIGEHKYWLMTYYEKIAPYFEDVNYAINRAPLYIRPDQRYRLVLRCDFDQDDCPSRAPLDLAECRADR